MTFCRRRCASAALAVIGWAAVLVAPTGASAAIVTTPAGLSPGDQYRLAFVTSTTRDATSSDIADYNAFVTTVANTQGALLALGATWTAIGSTPAVDARDNTGTADLLGGVPIYRLDGTKIADDNADLWDGTIDSPLGIFEDGSTASAIVVWTGSDDPGVAPNVNNSLGGSFPLTGISDTPAFSWIRRLTDASSQQHSFYALSSPLTVVPVPAALPLFLTALVGLIFVGRRRRQEAHT